MAQGVRSVTALETIAVALAMYSAVPVPQPVWNEKNMRYAMCAFPLVGVICAAAWWLWLWICSALGLPGLLRGAVLCALPVAITGGIHLDGYADTSDALASNAPAERKQQILGDSHCGAFAIIRLCVWFIVYFALCASLVPERDAVLCAGLGFVLSRTLSGLSVACLKPARTSGLVHTFAAAADKKRVRVFLSALAAALAAALLAVRPLYGAGMLAAAGLVFWSYARTVKKQFGGLSGDLAGWFLQRAELWMLAALVICQYLEATL